MRITSIAFSQILSRLQTYFRSALLVQQHTVLPAWFSIIHIHSKIVSAHVTCGCSYDFGNWVMDPVLCRFGRQSDMGEGTVMEANSDPSKVGRRMRWRCYFTMTLSFASHRRLIGCFKEGEGVFVWVYDGSYISARSILLISTFS